MRISISLSFCPTIIETISSYFILQSHLSLYFAITVTMPPLYTLLVNFSFHHFLEQQAAHISFRYEIIVFNFKISMHFDYYWYCYCLFTTGSLLLVVNQCHHLQPLQLP